MLHHRIAPLWLAITALLLTTVTEATAQACVGVPSRGGQLALQAGVGLTSEATSYGAGFTANLRGPLAVSGSYERTNLHDDSLTGSAEPHGSTFSGDLAFEIPGIALSVCPAFGAAYSRVSGLSTGIYPGPYTTITSASLSLDVGVGRTLSVTPGLFATPFAAAGVVFLHSEAQAESGGFRTPKYKDDDSAFGGLLGLVIGNRRVHVGSSVAFTTIEDSDPVFTLGAGIVF